MRAQELPTSTILLIVLAIIVLVLVFIFVLHPVSLFGLPSPSLNLTSFVHNCQIDCDTATSNNPANTAYCKDTMIYQGNLIHCYNITSSGNIGKGSCTYTADNGSLITANSSTC